LLIRHAESTANLDPKYYAEHADYGVSLTQFGYDQAVNSGKALKDFFEKNPELSGKKIRIYFSPYLRTKQTKNAILEHAGDALSSEKAQVELREEPLLVERDFGTFTLVMDDKARKKHYSNELEHIERLNQKGGGFFAKQPNGESRADASRRMEFFIQRMMGSADRNDIDCVIVISHSEVLKYFEKVFFHKDIKWLESEPNMNNGDIKLIERKADGPYTSERLFENKKRTPSMPKDYKVSAYGVDVNQKEAAYSRA
jgi:2,3-bisphosphoglycerate-dependent phosphoglycerate mutase